MPVLLVCFNMCAAGPHRLTTIDESASILSDISYDKTDDSLVSTLPVKNKFTLCKEKRSLVVMFEVPLSCCSSTVSGLGLFPCEDGATEEKGEEGGQTDTFFFPLFRTLSSISIMDNCLIVLYIFIYSFVSAPQGITSMVLLWLPNDLDRRAELPKW